MEWIGVLLFLCSVYELDFFTSEIRVVCLAVWYQLILGT